MSTPADYVAFLNRNGVRLWVDNGQLRYRARKGALSSEELARLRSMRSEIVAELTKAGSAITDSPTGAHPVRAAEAPLSFQQQWLLKLLEEHSNWNAALSHTFRLKGALDSTALERSFAGILRMHAALRTRIVRVGEEWRQQIEPVDGFQLPVVQVSGECEAEREQNALRLIQNLAARGLDRSVAPLASVQLIRVAEREHFLVLLFHRVATDCLGIGQALRDLWALYGQLTQEPASTDLERSAQYLDYVLAQHAGDGAWLQKHAAYWNDYLAGAGRILWPAKEYRAPASREIPRVLACVEVSFGQRLSAGLKELSRQTQTLPALVTMALYVACVSMWCGQKDLVVPLQIAGRAAAHEGIVGCFAHIVYLRIRLKGGESFIELLKVVSNEFYKAAAFRQDCGRMVTRRPELLRGTLCQWLPWHPADIPAGPSLEGQLRQLGLEVEQIRCQSLEELTNVPPETVDLEINFFEAQGDISALAIYRADRFAEGAPRRLMQELRSVAERAVRDSRAPIAG